MTKTTVEEVANRLKNGGTRLTIVDSRSAEAWDEAEVKAGGALRVPPDEPEKQIGDVRKDDYIVTYCTCPNEESSSRVAQVLKDHGIPDVHPLAGGFDAWQKANLPVEPK